MSAPPGAGIDPLLLNDAQTQRRGRGWWRMLLDQYGAADILVAEVELRRLYPGGPAVGHLHRALRPRQPVPRPLRAARGEQQRDPHHAGRGRPAAGRPLSPGAAAGLLRPDPSLVILAAPLPPALEEAIEEPVVENGSATAPEAAEPPAGDDPELQRPGRHPRRRLGAARRGGRSAGSAASPPRSPPASRSAAPR